MKIALFVLTIFFSIATSQAADLRYDAIPFIIVEGFNVGGIDAIPLNEFSNIDSNDPLEKFECPLGMYKTNCIYPRYKKDQLLRILANPEGELYGELASRFGLDKILEDPDIYLEKISLDDVSSLLLAGEISRYKAAVFEFGPLPVFPTFSFIPYFAGQEPEVISERAQFNIETFRSQVGRLSVQDFVSHPDIIPVWASTPMSFEIVDSELMKTAWSTWEKLADESEATCPYDETGCDLKYVVHKFGDGPDRSKNGFVACEGPELHEPTFMAKMCTIMAFETSNGQRYLKSLYGPTLAIEAGGFYVNSAGFIELYCDRDEEISRALKIEHISDIMHQPRYGTTLPDSTIFVNPTKLVVAVNKGDPLEDFENKFVFLFVIAYDGDPGFWMNITAREWIRAEPNPSQYPVFSDTNAIKLVNFLSRDFSPLGYKCSTGG